MSNKLTKEINLREQGSNLVTKYRHVLYAGLLLSPTYAGARVEYYLLFVLAVFIFERKRLWDIWNGFKENPTGKAYRIVWLVAIILFLSGLNKLFFGNEITTLRDYYSAFYLFPLLLLSSRLGYAPKLFRYLVYFTVIEAVVGIFEYAFGVRSFVMDIGDFNQIKDYSLLYNSRVYGLSVNSSVLGYKLLLAFILIDYVQLKKWLAWSLRIVLLAGLLIAFSRIALLVLLVYWGFGLLRAIYQLRWDFLKHVASLYYLCVIVLALGFNSELRNQLSRGDHQAESAFVEDISPQLNPDPPSVNAIVMKQAETDPAKQGWGEKIMKSAEGVQSSGRKLIWLNYINFIQDHPIVGNGCDKVMLSSWNPTKKSYELIHAHNSYLQLFATNGIVIALLYVLFYILYFKTRNFIPIAIILLYSLGNYGIFWGFSYMDVILLILLTEQLKTSYDNP